MAPVMELHSDSEDVHGGSEWSSTLTRRLLYHGPLPLAAGPKGRTARPSSALVTRCTVPRGRSPDSLDNTVSPKARLRSPSHRSSSPGTDLQPDEEWSSLQPARDRGSGPNTGERRDSQDGHRQMQQGALAQSVDGSSPSQGSRSWRSPGRSYRATVQLLSSEFPAPASQVSSESSRSLVMELGNSPDASRHPSLPRAPLQDISLATWFRHFDKNLNGRIDYQEFLDGMRSLDYQDEHIQNLWREMDADNNGELTFDEIDFEQAQMWASFRKWCGTKFEGPRDMIVRIRDVYAEVHGLPRSQEEVLTDVEFEAGIAHFGWDKGFAVVLFRALDTAQEDEISARSLEWLKVEVRKHKQKEEAKKRALRMAALRSHNKQVGQFVRNDFKALLKRSFGHLFRAWRRALDPKGTMTVPRSEVYKVVRQLKWKGDVRALWQALDHDASGLTTLEELDPGCAQLLAQFKEWATLQWGPKCAVPMFTAMDRTRRKKLSYSQFVQECEVRGFLRKTKTLATWLDWQDKKCLQVDDFAFLDAWRPPAWLTATPNQAAAEEFKVCLKAKYGSVLKGWRSAMDKDNSNCCNWHEFQEAAKIIKHTHDVAGSWLALDEDLSGFITLKEIDEEAHCSLLKFKQWAEDEFGGVRSAFKVLDRDASGELTYREFRGACRNYGFAGDTKSLFHSLDTGGEGRIQLREVSFLDAWEVPTVGTTLDVPKLPPGVLVPWQQSGTPVPGPGAYDVPCSFAATDRVPVVRHCGTFSFAQRKETKKFAKSVGPANYDPSLQPTTQRKPAWSFGGAGRPTTPTPVQPPAHLARRSPSPRCAGHTSPVPGTYELRPLGSKGARY